MRYENENWVFAFLIWDLDELFGIADKTRTDPIVRDLELDPEICDFIIYIYIDFR